MPAATIEQGSRMPPAVQEAINRVQTAADAQTKTKYSILKSFLDTISTYAENHGLSNSALQTLVDVVKRPVSLDQKSQNVIIKSLYPASNVPSDLICTVIGCLGHGSHKAAVSSQQLLVKWIVMVADYLEEPSHLSKFYSVLFNLLDMMSIRAEICHVLVQITRRKHVQPFRIHFLQGLSKTAGQDHALLKLMFVYDKYASGILVLEKPRKNLMDSSHTDPDWVSQIERIHNKTSFTSTKISNRLASSRFLQRSSRRAKAPSTIQSDDEIENFVNRLEDIRLSDIDVSDLSDPVLQIYTSTVQKASEDQIDDVLSPVFNEQTEKLASGQSISKASSQILKNVLSYTRFTKSLPHSVIEFLKHYLPKWDGQQDQQLVLDLLAYLPILPFEDLQTTLLNALETAILINSTDSHPQTVLLQFYTTLLRHWTVLLTATAPTPSQTTSLTSLTAHTTLLTHTLLTTSPTQRTTSLILSHFSSHLPLLQPPLSLPIPPPPPQQIYLLLFHSPTLSTLSLLSSLLAHHKTAFESTSTSTAAPPSRPAEHIPLLNATLIDTCNLLFRSRAFNTSDPHALGCCLPSAVTQKLASYTASLDPPQALTGLFSLSHHPALVALSIHSFREMEDEAEEQRPGSVRVRHAGPITQKSLMTLGREGGVKVDWKEYRVAVLRWLEGAGVKGIRELGGATMKGLWGGRDAVGGAKEGGS